jgi:exodeoxyribonuclease VII large subunit
VAESEDRSLWAAAARAEEAAAVGELGAAGGPEASTHDAGDGRPQGIEGSDLPGPFPVGAYALRLREGLRQRPRVQLFGEVVNFRDGGRAKVYFELRDAGGALPCSAWRDDWEALRLGPGSVGDGARVVVGGGPDYYPGSATSSPAFTFLVRTLRVAGEGDLLAQLDRLRKLLDAEGLFAPQKRLPRPSLPRTIGVVCGRGGKARDDVLAGLRRRGWAGRLVWAHAPVQDRHAAPRIAAALRELAALPEVEVVVVARGGGSLADLFAFCDETLCRTVAMLRVPVVASIGHHTDRTLLDDVAAVSCSTPTHAAEAAVPLHCGEARAALSGAAERLRGEGRRAVVDRARALAAMTRAPAEHVARHRRTLHQQVRELRASARRRGAEEQAVGARRLLVIARKADAAALEHQRGADAIREAAGGLRRAGPAGVGRRSRDLERLALALAAHDPERTLERGYALVEGAGGELVTGAAAARAAGRVRLRFHDGRVVARVAAQRGSRPPLTDDGQQTLALDDLPTGPLRTTRKPAPPTTRPDAAPAPAEEKGP